MLEIGMMLKASQGHHVHQIENFEERQLRGVTATTIRSSNCSVDSNNRREANLVLNVEETLKAHVRYLLNDYTDRSTSFPPSFKKFVADLANKKDEEVGRLQSLNNTIKNLIERIDLTESTTTLTAAKAKQKENLLKDLNERLQKLQTTNSFAKHIFKTLDDIAKFMNELLDCLSDWSFAPKITKQIISIWQKKEDFKPVGRPTIFTTEQELILKDTVLFSDKMGYPLTRSMIQAIAREMCENPSTTKGSEQDNYFTDRWYFGWLERMEKIDPTVCEAFARTTSVPFQQWFNSANINWWFDVTKRKAIQYKVAREPTLLEKKQFGCTMVWLDPFRIMFSDETAICGALTSKAAAARGKVVTTKELLEAGSNKRRVANKAQNDYDGHITLIGGYNAVGQPTFPIVIFEGENPRQNTIGKLEAAMPKFLTVPCIWERYYERSIDCI